MTSASAATANSADAQDRYSIKDLADEFGVTARTLRYYEDEGLISPERIGQTRAYSQADRVRLAWILRGKRVGFSLSEIAEMLDLYDLDDGRSRQRRVTLERCRDRIDALTRQKADIEDTITELNNFCSLIEGLVLNADTGRWIDQNTGQPIANNYIQSTQGLAHASQDGDK